MQEVNALRTQDNGDIETEQKTAGNVVLRQAQAFVIENSDDYTRAVDFTKQVKGLSKRVEDYWKPLKDAAHKSWKSLTDREKSLLEPLDQAEAEIKKKMVAYQRKVQEEERAARIAADKKKKEEAERLLAAAEEADSNGNVMESEMILAQAEIVESASPVIQMRPKAKGVSTRTFYKAKVINEKLVPTEFAGIVIRPVDIPAINKLAQASKGKIKIPGIEIYKEQSVAVRA